MITAEDIAAFSDNDPRKESSDRPTQLRALAEDKVAATAAYASDLRAAADEIEKLRTQLHKMQSGLLPFAYTYQLACELMAQDLYGKSESFLNFLRAQMDTMHFETAYRSVFGRGWSPSISPLDDVTHVPAKGDNYVHTKLD